MVRSKPIVEQKLAVLQMMEEPLIQLKSYANHILFLKVAKSTK